MPCHEYSIHELLTVTSEFESFLLDSRRTVSDCDGEIHFREKESQNDSVEINQQNGQFIVSVTPRLRWCISKGKCYDVCSSAEFTEVLLSMLDKWLLQWGATIVFGGAAKSPEGDGVVLFGGSGSGKSTALFKLSRDFGYEILADDLLIFYDNRIYPFPRFVDLDPSIESIKSDVERLVSQHPTEVFQWGNGSATASDEVSVPRRLMPNSTDEIQADYCLSLEPSESRILQRIRNGSKRLRSNELQKRAISLNEGHIEDWRTHSDVTKHFTKSSNHSKILTNTIRGADCYEIRTPKAKLTQEINDVTR